MPVRDSNWCKVFELEDELDLDSRARDPLTKFDFPRGATIEGSVNGLLFLIDFDVKGDIHILYVCNPIAREFCELPSVPQPQGVAYGFGASKITGQHKVVSINPKSLINPKSVCHVYTLGAESWRRIEPPASSRYRSRSIGEFFNGNLHWIEYSNPNENRRITCFDVEAECFSTFSGPLQRFLFHNRLFTLRDCLCLCGESSEHEIVIWLMKEYEVEKSWSKEYVIPLNLDYLDYRPDGVEVIQPFKVLKNGDILMLWDDEKFYYYSNKTKTTQEIGLFGETEYSILSMLITPNFLSLKGLGMENVISF